MKLRNWTAALLAVAVVAILCAVGFNAPPEIAFAGLAIGMVAKRKEDEPANLSTDQQKTAGRTDSQAEIRAYHEGDFQTVDPVTGQKRDLDQAPSLVRLDRGETLDGGTDAK